MSTENKQRVEYRIYPSIGIARIGDSNDGFIEGPEAPGIAPESPYRGSDGGLRPQSARFRIYQVEIDANENEIVTAEITVNSKTKIEWSIGLANRKAAGFRIMDTLARSNTPRLRNDGYDRQKLVISALGTISGVNQPQTRMSGSIEFAKPGIPSHQVKNIELASIMTDAQGRLIVIGGPGKSASPLNLSADHFADNDGWYDSVSDGPIGATLEIDGTTHPVVSAWVVITVPRFTPEVYGVVTWYDQAVSMARTNNDGTFDSPRTTSFTRDIYPILKRADMLRWVHRPAHGSTFPRALSDATRLSELKDQRSRADLMARLTKLNSTANSAEELSPLRTMPLLYSGANPDPNGPTWVFPSLTRYQHAHFTNWVLGNFDADWEGQEPAPTAFSQIDIALQPRALCEAALETCIGSSFFPGIEATYDMARAETYHPRPNLRREFRLNPDHPAGFLTEKMALPWQADFADCTAYWWPSQRPVYVNTGGDQGTRWDRGINGVGLNGHLNMVANWAKLGLIVRDPITGKLIETDRLLP
ncbi:LodA/GoxA family CTQ-dependent oxidase [Nitrosomonas communis]|uniref:L-lysine 6-oxidase n=1 Tax=Nitrosomonas communis TaxID=44574 RepID=A0A1H2ZHM5_9PROT|nr:LodA/GoxA family CTQ-dependent oxidase [Nitrosomonas communis]SDX16992.1 hypothetical protein SAMN05421882_10778 [Nitrosomonas communis]